MLLSCYNEEKSTLKAVLYSKERKYKKGRNMILCRRKAEKKGEMMLCRDLSIFLSFFKKQTTLSLLM